MNNDQIIRDKLQEAQRQRLERQKESAKYIETNKLDNLLTECQQKSLAFMDFC